MSGFMAKYTNNGAVLKDGHTMFNQDIVAELNRKSMLESELISNRERIKELTELLQLCVNDMYKPSGKISKKTAMKLMSACQKKLVDFPG